MIHPVELAVDAVAESVALGLVAGLACWLTRADPSALIVYAVGLYVVMNVVTVAPLRHSHIAIRLGPLEALFVSPAHHQLHHSLERKHWDKIFGALFPIWDRMWRTLEAPPAQPYRQGLDSGQSADCDRVWRAYTTPLSRLRSNGLRRNLSIRPLFGPGHPP